MLTKFDKALVAVIMAGVQLGNAFGYHWGVDEATVTAIVTVLNPILIYIIPNKN